MHRPTHLSFRLPFVSIFRQHTNNTASSSVTTEGTESSTVRGSCAASVAERAATAEVFNLCHAVDPTEIPSSGGGPHGPRCTGFNLLYSWLGQNMSY